MDPFDYETEAELFPTPGRMATRKPVRYRRFARAAEAVRFAIEDMAPEQLRGAYLEVNEQRFDGKGIRQLYDDPAYPLGRKRQAA